MMTLINKFGKMAGWNSVSVMMLGRVIEGITALSYTEAVEKENVYGAGSRPIGRGSGSYSAKASLTLHKEEVIALQLSLGRGKTLSDIGPFDINVQYEYLNMIYSDRIRNCEFVSNGVETKQNDKLITVKFDLIVSHIEWAV